MISRKLAVVLIFAALPAFSQTPDKPVKPNGANAVAARDPLPAIESINRAWQNGLSKAKVTPAADAGDAEFLRRASLDLTGRIPSVRQAREFLDSSDPDKRRKLIDELLSNQAFGQHFGISWRLWLDPPEDGGKPKPDLLTPWLAQQLQRNRGWGDIVRDLVAVKGEIRNNPVMGFLLANSEVFRPKPEMLADSVSRLFMGVELRCAQCHNHPFADWKQEEFWGLAAFFSRVHPSTFKGGPNVTILESDMLPNGVKGDPAPGAALTVPAMSGPQSGKVVRARFPKGAELAEDKAMPYRDHLADWLVARNNPYFAKATVNRFWFLLFGGGLVNPLEGFDPKNPAANPELLDALAKEFADSDYDVKHLLRCICLSKPYQRTSRLEGKSAEDNPLVSRMAVKPMSPEMLYDSLAVVLAPDPTDKNKFSKPTGGDKPMPAKPIKPESSDKPMPMKPNGTDKPMPMKPMGNSGAARRDGPLSFSREDFVKFFRTRGGNIHAVNQGIPQTLRLLNDAELLSETPIVERLASEPNKRDAGIETLFLATYSRRPTAAETDLFNRYLTKQKDERAGYCGVLWILLNSSEFLLNH